MEVLTKVCLKCKYFIGGIKVPRRLFETGNTLLLCILWPYSSLISFPNPFLLMLLKPESFYLLFSAWLVVFLLLLKSLRASYQVLWSKVRQMAERGHRRWMVDLLRAGWIVFMAVCIYLF